MTSKVEKLKQRNVVFENTLNEVVDIKKLKKMELRLFYALVMSVHNKGTDTIVLKLNELKETTKYKKTTKSEWKKVVSKTFDKVFPLFWKKRINGQLEMILLFKQLTYNFEDDLLIVRINKSSEFIFNDIKKTFTKFGWANFVRLNSKYAQILFPQLQQYNSIGKRVFSKEELYKLFNVPESMRPSNNFNKRIMNPIKEELSEVFLDFEVVTHRGHGRGRPVEAYEFRWNNANHRARIEQKQQKEVVEARRKFHGPLRNGDDNEPSSNHYRDWIGEIKGSLENK
jgi:plasmid replication initiation protein